jgi:aminoglycoside 3-N-acetyltransferase
MTDIRTSLRHAKLALKSRWMGLRSQVAQRFLSYGEEGLLQALRRLGVREGDDLMLHSSFAPQHGFRGSIEQLTDVFIKAVGRSGNLLMVSLPYRSSSLEYLRRLRSFDVRRAPSMMGLVTEHFRRRPDVLRSLHPTHPVLVHGPDAAWYVERHERALFPCGPGTPFEKLAKRDAMVAFFNVPFAAFTFFHHLEHLISGQLPFALYTEQPFEVPVLDRDGQPGVVRTYAFASEAIARRRFEVLERALRSRGVISAAKVGNTRIEAIRVRAAIDCVHAMASRGEWFYDLDATVAADAHHVSRGE